MKELREITTKHKASDAEALRRAVSQLDTRERCMPPEALQLLLYATDLARRIDEAFARSKVVDFQPRPRPEPPEAA